MTTKGTAGIIGVGVMGVAIANNLVEAGFEVVGYDVAPAGRERLEKLGGRVAASNADVLRQAGVVITSLPSAKALASVVDELAAAALESAIPAGSIVAETGTLALADKQAAFDTLARAGIAMLDCPLSGSANRAAIRDVLVYASGDKAAYDRALSVFEGFSRAPFYVGSFGNGSKLKYIANHLVAIHTMAAGEAFALARKAGLDPAAVYDAIIGGAGGSRVPQRSRGDRRVCRRDGLPCADVHRDASALQVGDRAGHGRAGYGRGFGAAAGDGGAEGKLKRRTGG
jgi:L-threonate 2-dehydrogenase